MISRKLSLLKDGSGINEMISLDKNENPFPLPPSPREELRQVLSDVPMNRYPDPDSIGLKEALSDYCGFPAENIIVGNGGDEILYLLFLAFVRQGGRALTLDPTFSEYYHLFNIFGVEHKKIPLQEELAGFSFDGERLLESLSGFSPQLTLLDTPNNPSGMTLSGDFLEEVIRLSPGVTVIDEAYVEFAEEESVLERFRGKDLPKGTLVLRTLSKAWGLAGLRVGYAVCDPWTRDRMEQVRPPYNINSLSQIAAKTVLSYRDWMESRVYSLRYIRDNFVDQVNQVPGWKAFPSQSNFVLVKVPGDYDKVENEFRQKRIQVKRVEWEQMGGTCLRVTVGREEEMTAFLGVIQGHSVLENRETLQAREA